jgi:hypothetical protein
VFDIEHKALGNRRRAARAATSGGTGRTAQQVDFVRNSARIAISVEDRSELARIVLDEATEGEGIP